jgi:hypothetical protein
MWTPIAKWTRKLHAWLALPLFAAIIIVQASLAGSMTPVAGRLQQVLMLMMAVTGVFLFVYPRVKRARRRRRTTPH